MQSEQSRNDSRAAWVSGALTQGVKAMIVNTQSQSPCWCDLRRLVSLLDRKLSLDERLEVFDHLDSCVYCRESIYLIARERDLLMRHSRRRK